MERRGREGNGEEEERGRGEEGERMAWRTRAVWWMESDTRPAPRRRSSGSRMSCETDDAPRLMTLEKLRMVPLMRSAKAAKDGVPGVRATGGMAPGSARASSDIGARTNVTIEESGARIELRVGRRLCANDGSRDARGQRGERARGDA